jgi:hypothetical protein
MVKIYGTSESSAPERENVNVTRQVMRRMPTQANAGARMHGIRCHAAHRLLLRAQAHISRIVPSDKWKQAHRQHNLVLLLAARPEAGTYM